jgi:hypothetical protein
MVAAFLRLHCRGFVCGIIFMKKNLPSVSCRQGIITFLQSFSLLSKFGLICWQEVDEVVMGIFQRLANVFD